MRSKIGFKAHVEAIENAMLNNQVDINRESMLYHVERLRLSYQKAIKKLKQKSKDKLTKRGQEIIGLN